MGWVLQLIAVAAAATIATAAVPHNVLYIVYDDLRPDLSMYGAAWMQTPSLQKLADTGVTFTRAYCQQTVCSPSRMSFTTGRRPNTTATWNFLNHFRQAECLVSNRVRVRAGTALPHTRLGDGLSFTGQVGLTGGSGQCCTDCTAITGCAGWSMLAGNCTLYRAVSRTEPCPPTAVGCMSGTPGTFPKWTPLPQNLQNQGHLTLGVGKYYHDVNKALGVPGDWRYPAGTGLPPQADPPSWSNVSVQNVNLSRMQDTYGRHLQLFKGCAYTGGVGRGYVNAMDGCTGKDPTTNKSFEICNAGAGVGVDGAGAVPALCDRIAFEDVENKLPFAKRHAERTQKGFFLAVGVRRPHLTWRVPQHYLDLYPAASVSLPAQLTLDKSIDPIAWSQFPGLNGDAPYALNNSRHQIRANRQAYYAAVSWADHVAGHVLDALDANGLAESTAVVVHSDHGWHLGEYNMWEKRTLWENAARVPLIIRVPWLPGSAGKRATQLVELVDIYRTVCDLLGADLPGDDAHAVEGMSLMPVLTDPGGGGGGWTKTAALTTYPRCPQQGLPAWDLNSCIHSTERVDFAYMGYSMRVDHTDGASYRFTEWYPWDGAALAPDTSIVRATELYNHSTPAPSGASEFDLHENVNLAAATDPALVEALRRRLHAAFALA